MNRAREYAKLKSRSAKNLRELEEAQRQSASAEEERDTAQAALVKYKSRSHMMLKKLERELQQEKRNGVALQAKLNSKDGEAASGGGRVCPALVATRCRARHELAR